MDNNQNQDTNLNNNEDNPAVDEENIDSSDGQVSDTDNAADSPQNVGNTKSANKPKKKISEYFSFSGIRDNIKNFWADSSANRKIFIIVCAAIILLLIVAITIALNVSRYTLLHSYVEAAEAGQMMSILQNENIKAEYNPTFGSISVKDSDVSRAVMALASGYGQKGVMKYESLSNTNIFRTDADIDQENKINLQNWLSAAINTLSPVEYAYVTVTPADNSDAILKKDYKTAKATVIIHLMEGAKLSSKQILGIETLLLNGVSSIVREDIAILDGNGVQLNVPTDEDSDTIGLYELKLKFEREYEAQANLKAFRILERLFPPDAVVVESNVTANFDKWIEESKQFLGANTDPDTGEIRGIVTAEAIDRYVSSGGDISAWGAAGTNLNIDDPTYYESMADPEEGPYSDEFHRTEEYLVDYVTRQLQHSTPEIKNMSLTASVDADEIDSEKLDDLIIGLANATGIRDIAWNQAIAYEEEPFLDAEYLRNFITIVASPFHVELEPGTEEAAPWWLFGLEPMQLGIIAIIVLLVLVLLIVLLVVLLKRRNGDTSEVLEEEQEGDGLSDAFGKAIARRAAENVDIDLPSESREIVLKKQIKLFSDQNPEVAAQLIRTLLKEEGSQNG